MSAEPVTIAPVQAAHQQFAWYGKLPSAGDFISRRMPYVLQQFWDRWCASGMEVLKERNPVSGWALWGNAPKWAFILPTQPGIAMGQLGVLAPSCDRVGRNFPFLVTTPIITTNVAEIVPRAATIALAWCEVIREAQSTRGSLDVIDGLLANALANELARETPPQDAEVTLPQGTSPTTLPWPGLGESFDLRSTESFWWSVPPASTGFRARTHIGPLNATHFCALCA